MKRLENCFISKREHKLDKGASNLQNYGSLLEQYNHYLDIESGWLNQTEYAHNWFDFYKLIRDKKKNKYV